MKWKENVKTFKDEMNRDAKLHTKTENESRSVKTFTGVDETENESRSVLKTFSLQETVQWIAKRQDPLRELIWKSSCILISSKNKIKMHQFLSDQRGSV